MPTAQADTKPALGISITYTIPADRVANLMTSFVESGDPVTRAWVKGVYLSRYDGMGTEKALKALALMSPDPWYAVDKLYDGTAPLIIEVHEYDEETGKVTKHALTLDSLAKGLTLLASGEAGDYSHHFAAILADNTDAGTADIFMQMATFGKEVYA